MADIGRPTDYDPAFCQEAADLCAQGATDKELADFFEVSTRSIYRWAAKFPEFSRALKIGKELADERVIRSLYHKACGYTFDAVKIFMTKEGETVYAPYVEHIPPDSTAAIFWLKNRRPADWREKSEQEITGKDGAPLVPVINISGRPSAEPASAPKAVDRIRDASD